MMSSSEVQRITLSAKKIVSASGAIDVEQFEDEEEENEDLDNDDKPEIASTSKGEDIEDASTLEIRTPISAANSECAVDYPKSKELKIKS